MFKCHLEMCSFTEFLSTYYVCGAKDTTYNSEDRATTHMLQSCRSQKDRSQSNNQEGNSGHTLQQVLFKFFTSRGIIVKKGTGAEGLCGEGRQWDQEVAGAQQDSVVEAQKHLMLEVLPYPALLLLALALYRMDVKPSPVMS